MKYFWTVSTIFVILAMSDGLPRKCRRLWCYEQCNYGQEIDDNGCETCRCLPPPIGLGLSSFQNYTSLNILSTLSKSGSSYWVPEGAASARHDSTSI